MTSDTAPILVLGNGGFGTAVAITLHSGGHRVSVWGFDAEETRDILLHRENRKYLPGIALPGEIRFSSDISEIAPGARLVVSVVPTQFLRSTIERLRPHLPQDAAYISCSKGFERTTLQLPSRILRELLPRSRVAVLSGPSHAEEVGRGLPAAVVVSSDDPELSAEIQALLTTAAFRVYTSRDPLGIEIAGATKNVIALAAGISDGLGFGDNARAALLCRGAREMTRLGAALGAELETFAGLSGIGDLIATCTSRHSRNRAVGLRIAAGESLGDILASASTVAEGVETTRSLHHLAARLGVELPITAEVHAVLFEGKPPREAVVDLMTRQLRTEM